METARIIYDGCRLDVPIMPDGKPLHLPYDGFASWHGTYCGPGEFGDMIVPDNLFGVPINVACFIHDHSNALAETTEEDHDSNVMFRENMFAILRHLEPKPEWKDKFHYARWHRAILYYEAVDTCGLRRDVV